MVLDKLYNSSSNWLLIISIELTSKICIELFSKQENSSKICYFLSTKSFMFNLKHFISIKSQKPCDIFNEFVCFATIKNIVQILTYPNQISDQSGREGIR